MDSVAALLQRLEALQRAGVQTLPRGSAFALPPEAIPPAAETVVSSHLQTVSPVPAVASPAAGNSRPDAVTAARFVSQSTVSAPSADSLASLPFPTDLPQGEAELQALLDDVQGKVAACKLCEELACTRKQTVFGVGNVRPRVVFFGEAPGADEDRLGEPFVGAAGQLLTKIIQACTWQRHEVYILNTLKCRPPGNRNPEPHEVSNCRPFFERQLEILRPEFIVCLGAVAAHALLENNDAVGKMRRNFHSYRGATVVVTYHPSYLLRNPDAKRHVWDDMQKLLHKMGIVLPGR